MLLAERQRVESWKSLFEGGSSSQTRLSELTRQSTNGFTRWLIRAWKGSLWVSNRVRKFIALRREATCRIWSLVRACGFAWESNFSRGTRRLIWTANRRLTRDAVVQQEQLSPDRRRIFLRSINGNYRSKVRYIIVRHVVICMRVRLQTNERFDRGSIAGAVDKDSSIK